MPNKDQVSDEHMNAILDNFNMAVATASITIKNEPEWTKRYESIKKETIKALNDSVIHQRQSVYAVEVLKRLKNLPLDSYGNLPIAEIDAAIKSEEHQ